VDNKKFNEATICFYNNFAVVFHIPPSFPFICENLVYSRN